MISFINLINRIIYQGLNRDHDFVEFLNIVDMWSQLQSHDNHRHFKNLNISAKIIVVDYFLKPYYP